MLIQKIRDTIYSCNWTRNDLGGATRAEFLAMNVPEILTPKIRAVRALEIPARFTRDIEDKSWAISCAEKLIDRWNNSHADTSTVTQREKS